MVVWMSLCLMGHPHGSYCSTRVPPHDP
jgi:hypothetical protein